MINHHNKATTNNMSAVQRKTLQRFQKRLAQALPNFRIAWAIPVDDDFIELHLETDKRTYRNSVKAAKLAIEAGEETGVMIILR
jgi:hypothetical protein